MKRNSRWLFAGVCALMLAISSAWAQSQPPEKPAPEEKDKKTEKADSPAKKMRKINTPFGEKWVEDTSPPPSSPEAPAQPSGAAPTNPQVAPADKTKTGTGLIPPPNPQAPAKPEPAETAKPGVTPPSKTDLKEAGVKAPGGDKEASTSPAPQAASGPAQPSTASPAANASLVFNNADLVQVIQVIANLLHLNYVLDPAVKGSVTITTMGDISNADLMQILQAVLRINGCTAIQSGNIWQIVPLKSAHQIPIPMRTPGGQPLAPDDTLITEIIPMEFVSASDMTKLLKEFLSDAGSIVSHDRGNILILTDASRNMARLLDLIRTFDSEALASQRIRLFAIKNNSARALAADLTSIFGAYGMSEKESAIRFLPIDRLNSILAMAPSPSSLDVVQQWIDKLDQPAQVAGMRNYVYPLQFAKAREIRGLLAQLYGSVIASENPGQRLEQGGASGVIASSTAGLSPSTILSQASKPEENAGKREVFGFQGQIKIVADDLNNMLIIQSSPQDYNLIQQTIRQIDIMPRQVLIQAQIFSVDLENDFSLGVTYAFQQRGTGVGGTSPLASFTGGTLSGSAVILNAGARELFAQITASENRTRTKELSAPSILATDNKESRIQVGVSIPTLSSSGYTPGTTNTIFNTVQNVDTGVILSVTPHVSAGGIVGLTVNQEVSSPVQPPAGVTNISPSINRSTANTSFVVRDGDTVAIAGIITENKSLTRNRIPLLGDIPFLGAAFGSTSYTNKRSELIIFITPHVINVLDQQGVVSEALREEMKKLKKDFRDNDKSRLKVWDKVPTISPEP
jgi:general secretion pathway protein D